MVSVLFLNYISNFDLEIDVLTFKMTLNNKNNIRYGFLSQKNTKRGITRCPSYIS